MKIYVTNNSHAIKSYLQYPITVISSVKKIIDFSITDNKNVYFVFLEWKFEIILWVYPRYAFMQNNERNIS